jgi:lysophospholipase L1-like esterase
MPKVRVFRPADFAGDIGAPDLNSFYPVLLAEGDSWFTLGSIPAHNLLEGLDFPTFGAVINLANPGDTIADMRRALESGACLRRIDAWASEFGRFVADSAAYPLSAIVLSGGGNDLIEAIPHLLKRDIDFDALDPAQAAEAIDAEALAQFDRFLTDSFAGIVGFVRDHGGPNAHVPIFCHTYDYPTPNDAPARILGVRVGQAWIQPKLVAAGVPQRLWVPLTDHLIRHLAATLKGLRLEDFHVVNTLDTLVRAQPGATGESGDWENEIHPTRAGYKKLGRKLSKAIADELGLQEKEGPVA